MDVSITMLSRIFGRGNNFLLQKDNGVFDDPGEFSDAQLLALPSGP